MMSILLNLLRSVSWPRIWSLLVSDPWISEEQVYSAFEQSVACSSDTTD